MIETVIPALVMGLFGGAHCAVMCGAASSALCAAGPASGRYALFYNGGRVGGYAALGLAAASLGALPLGPAVEAVRFALRSLAAICMLSVGLHLAGLPSFVRGLERAGAPIWRHVAPVARRLVPLRSRWHAVGAGAVWAFMPCGLLYGALALAASAPSPSLGAATMVAFGIGTLPVMLVVGLVARRAAGALGRAWVRRAASCLMLVFGLWATAGVVQHATGSAGRHACCPRR